MIYYSSIEFLLKVFDFLLLYCLVILEIVNLMNLDSFVLFFKGVVFVNVVCGVLVDEDVLLEVLKSG